MIPLLIGIFLIILFIVFLVLSASTWRGGHIAAVCLTFLAALGLVVVGSLAQKTHVKWKSEYDSLKKQLVEERATGVKLEIGDPTLVVPDEPSMLDIQQRLSSLLVDRGRVWRRCSVTSTNPIQISTIPPNPDGTRGDPALAQESGINQNMVLYAFREGPISTPDGGQMFVPVAYLGEFQVVNAQPAQLTLAPTLPLDGQQVAMINDPSATWALYEMMPLDAHRIFSKSNTIGQTLDNTTDQPVFGEMDELQIRQAFATVTGQAPDSPLVDEFVSNYIKDGYAATDQDINRYPTNIWQKLEFEKDRSADDQVDSPNADEGVDGYFFDSSGRAVASRLRRGDVASFRTNDIGVFPYGQEEDRQWVDDRVADGTCQKIGPIFVRSLRDYEEAFHDIQQRFIRRNEEIRRTQTDIDNLNTAIRKTSEEIAYRQSEREKLKEDQTGFARDNAKMDQLLASLEGQKSTLRQQLSDLYQTNLALNQQLTIYSAKLTEEINRRASSVAVQ